MSIVRRLQRVQQERRGGYPGRGAATIAICTPCDDEVKTVYAVSLVQMIMHTWNAQSPGISGMQLMSYGSSILPFSRNVLAKSALEAGATHILWIDSDMEFAPDTLLRLLAHGKDIVAANCSTRRPPFRNTARILGDEVPLTLDSTGIQKVDRVGLGVALVTTRVFEALPLPWFHFEWLAEEQVFRGEDFAFFEAAKARGFEIWIDHDVSKGVRHMGSFGYNPILKTLISDEERDEAIPASAPGAGGMV